MAVFRALLLLSFLLPLSEGAALANKARTKVGNPAGASAGIDVGGLGDALKDGGAEGLLKALQAVQATHKNSDADFNIIRDAHGHATYDFVVTTPPTTEAPPTLKPPAPVLAKTVAAGSEAAAPASTSDGGDDSDSDDESASTSPNPGKSAAPVVNAVGVNAVGATAAGSGSFAALASGLADVRQRVDTLSAAADAAVRGQPFALPQQTGGASPQLESEIQGLLHRVDLLEKENKELNKKVDTQASHLDTLQHKEEEDEKQLAQVKEEEAGLRKSVAARASLLHKKGRVHHHKAKSAAR